MTDSEQAMWGRFAERASERLSDRQPIETSVCVGDDNGAQIGGLVQNKDGFVSFNQGTETTSSDGTDLARAGGSGIGERQPVREPWTDTLLK